MASFNKVIMIGNLTRDPSLTYLPNTQTPVCEIGLAVNRRWRNRNGEQQENDECRRGACPHRCAQRAEGVDETANRRKRSASSTAGHMPSVRKY